MYKKSWAFTVRWNNSKQPYIFYEKMTAMTLFHKTKIQLKYSKQRLIFLFLIKSRFHYENDMVSCFMRRKLIMLTYPSKYQFILFEFIRKFQKDFMIWKIKEERNIKHISKISWLAMTSENSDWSFHRNTSFNPGDIKTHIYWPK